jgi:transposase
MPSSPALPRGSHNRNELNGCYSPDFNPIEKAFAKLKALLRREQARSIDALWQAIGRLIDFITPAECVNMFAAAGYDPD